MTSYTRVHSADQSCFPSLPPRTAHHQQARTNRHSYNHLGGDSFENIPLAEQGMHYGPQAPEVQTHQRHSGDQRCLKKPSNAISTASFGLGALATAAHFVLPHISSLADNAAVIAAEKPLLYGGISGMVLGAAIQLAKFCRGTDPTGSRNACIVTDCSDLTPDCGNVDCVDAACCCLACL